MAYKQKNSPFRQTATVAPKAEEVTIGKRAKRSLKEAYDIALTKGYRKKSESFADYAKRAKADPLYGKSGSKGYTVKAVDGMVEMPPYKDKISVKDLKDKEAKNYAAKIKTRDARASKIRKSKKLNEQALKNRPKVKEAKEVKLEPQKINIPKKTTTTTTLNTPKKTTTTLKAPKKPRVGSGKAAARRYEREMRTYNRKNQTLTKKKQGKRETAAMIARAKGKIATILGDKEKSFKLVRKEARIKAKIAKTNKKMSEAAEDKSKVKTKVKSRRRAPKGSIRATLRK